MRTAKVQASLHIRTYAQSRQKDCCSLVQAEGQGETSDKELDMWSY